MALNQIFAVNIFFCKKFLECKFFLCENSQDKILSKNSFKIPTQGVIIFIYFRVFYFSI